jgi:hypothetical protein
MVTFLRIRSFPSRWGPGRKNRDHFSGVHDGCRLINKIEQPPGKTIGESLNLGQKISDFSGQKMDLGRRSFNLLWASTVMAAFLYNDSAREN